MLTSPFEDTKHVNGTCTSDSACMTTVACLLLGVQPRVQVNRHRLPRRNPNGARALVALSKLT